MSNRCSFCFKQPQYRNHSETMLTPSHHRVYSLQAHFLSCVLGVIVLPFVFDMFHMLKLVNMLLFCNFGFPSFSSPPFLPIFSQVSCPIKIFQNLDFPDCIPWCHLKRAPVPYTSSQLAVRSGSLTRFELNFLDKTTSQMACGSHQEAHIVWFSLCGTII